MISKSTMHRNLIGTGVLVAAGLMVWIFAGCGGAPAEKEHIVEPILEIKHSNFSGINDIKIDREGRIVVTDRVKEKIYVFDAGGNLLLEFGESGSAPEEFSRPFGVAINSRNQMVITDRENTRVQIFEIIEDDEGHPKEAKHVDYFGSRGISKTQFIDPQGIAVDAQDNLYVLDADECIIKVFDPEFQYLRSFGKKGSGPGEFNKPKTLIMDAEGNLWVADQGNFRVQKLDTNGKWLLSIGSRGHQPGMFFAEIEGIAVDPEGRIFTVDEGAGKIQIFDAAGNFIFAFGIQGGAAGMFSSPDGAVIDPRSNRLYVVDEGNHRIQVFDLANVWRAKASEM